MRIFEKSHTRNSIQIDDLKCRNYRIRAKTTQKPYWSLSVSGYKILQTFRFSTLEEFFLPLVQSAHPKLWWEAFNTLWHVRAVDLSLAEYKTKQAVQWHSGHDFTDEASHD